MPLTAENQTPLLTEGDRLSITEFRRRYENMPNIKAELIHGVVYMPSPVSLGNHASQHGWVVVWLGNYFVSTPGTEFGDNPTLRDLDQNSEPQPDAMLRIAPTHGGQSRTDQEQYLIGAPELVAEITATSRNYDLGPKMDVYREGGVCEYIVWRTIEGAIDWFILRNRQYERLIPDSAGIIQSEVFPGLWLDVPAMLGGNLAQVLQTLQLGIASPEHADFVQRLQTT